MGSERRLSISASEVEVGAGLPPERYYVHSPFLPPLGHVTLPEDYRATPFGDEVRIDRMVGPFHGGLLGQSTAYAHFATLSTREFLRSAIAGTFGMAWEPVLESPR